MGQKVEVGLSKRDKCWHGPAHKNSGNHNLVGFGYDMGWRNDVESLTSHCPSFQFHTQTNVVMVSTTIHSQLSPAITRTSSCSLVRQMSLTWSRAFAPHRSLSAVSTSSLCRGTIIYVIHIISCFCNYKINSDILFYL